MCIIYIIICPHQVEGPVHNHDDVVRVLDDIAEVHRLQQDHCGWEDDMVLVSLYTCTV